MAGNADIELALSAQTGIATVNRQHTSPLPPPPSISGDDPTEAIEHSPLPPTDRGKAAWLVLAGCSVIQAPVWGMQPSRASGS